MGISDASHLEAYQRSKSSAEFQASRRTQPDQRQADAVLFSFLSFAFISRLYNKVAHSLARCAIELNDYSLLIDDVSVAHSRSNIFARHFLTHRNNLLFHSSIEVWAKVKFLRSVVFREI